jgi:hypothetical protein
MATKSAKKTVQPAKRSAKVSDKALSPKKAASVKGGLISGRGSDPIP